MNKQLLPSRMLAACAALWLVPAPGVQAQPMEYVRVCDMFGSGFHYIPGTDVCLNSATGDARQVTEGGTWRSILPYPQGEWASSTYSACNGRLVKLGTFAARDFTPNAWNRMQTRAVPVGTMRNEFVSKVIFSGGFQDPRLPRRQGTNSADGLCVRAVDPGSTQNTGGGVINPPFGNGGLPVGCVANSRIVNMPGVYAVNATAAYPSVDAYYLDGGQQAVGGPYNYGTRLVVTTDFGNATFQQLQYYDARTSSAVPLAGSVSVAVCLTLGL